MHRRGTSASDPPRACHAARQPPMTGTRENPERRNRLMAERRDVPCSTETTSVRGTITCRASRSVKTNVGVSGGRSLTMALEAATTNLGFKVGWSLVRIGLILLGSCVPFVAFVIEQRVAREIEPLTAERVAA